ncbi:aldehyde dehydrogenase (NADP(+)) [Micromonospora endolithica]|uniref:Aldehyde dehydrogenase (NADP(+)) n=1 Tax=Micromonospora endolithica TaxID=230091 RepID=A0A3A9ZUI3_9ACTN|nr:aldehyde dehydrogenase (NADP(+)) [Micromonospora endolithica]RKN51196.1 aldehyde dehydrogenase (NADP(+)) [Micromonospora endolithica]TWJ22406.1 NADP-dependent aldehyde dehydrogenase [Micromonospora endolithica]
MTPPVPTATPPVTTTVVAEAVAAARAAAPILARDPLPARAGRLRAAADALDGSRAEIVALADTETHLGEARLTGELARTTGQLRLFADAVEEGSFLDITIDHADPGATPVPRPDVRRMMRPLGPVAVFAASNFPLAFSVAGGDTAAALAAGCPVVVKAHEGHPRLSDLVGRVLADLLPPGAVTVLHGRAAGRDLVTDPAVRAVGFTGSEAGGRALFDLATARPDPIPFYGELGSVNPVVVTPAALAARGAAIAAAYVASYTLGLGQFCTKPGLLFLPAGHGLEPALVEAVRAVAPGPLLGEWIRGGFDRAAAALAGIPGVRSLVPPTAGSGITATPALLAVPAARFLAEPAAARECFGPASLIVEYADPVELLAALNTVPGALTATVHTEPGHDVDLVRVVLDVSAERAGRVVLNGWPTGVAVTWAMHHGGPWPATTAPLHTSVGVAAIRRFLRPVAYQDVPAELLPEALREDNPLRLPRRVDGVLTARPGAPSA